MNADLRRLLPTVVISLLLVGAGVLTARTLGLDANAVRGALATLGPWAWPAYLLVFVVGVLLHLPGVAFIVAAPLLFGVGPGLGLAYTGSVLSASAGFRVARRVVPALKPAEERSLLDRTLEHVEDHPVRAIALLRAVMVLSPPLQVALAWAPIRQRDHLLGSMLGLLPPVLVLVLGTGALT